MDESVVRENLKIIRKAIEADGGVGRKISFHFNGYNEKKQLVPRRNAKGEVITYLASPYYVILYNGKYYLICYVEPYDNVSFYRIDLMSDITDRTKPSVRDHKTLVTDRRKPKRQVNGLPLDWNDESATAFQAEHMYMFYGEPCKIRLKIDHDRYTLLHDYFFEKYTNFFSGENLRVLDCIIGRVNSSKDSKQEAPMLVSEIRTSIQKVYGMLWEIIRLYEKTECYNKVPEGDKEMDIWQFMEEKLAEVRKEVSTLFLGNEKLYAKLNRVVDETEYFVRSYESPGVVKRWKQMNPRLIFFDCAFDLMEESPETFQEISWGLADVRLSCYLDETLVKARNSYFANIKKKNEDGNLRYSEERIFQDELLRTLTLVFTHDFKEYL